MNILAIWQKQIQQVTKKDTRSILLLSYRRLLQILASYAYFLVPISIVFVLLSIPQSIFPRFGFSFFAAFLAQITALLLRPSRYKKDVQYVIRIFKNNYWYLFLLPIFSLIVPIVVLPFFLAFLVFFQLIAADGKMRKISFFRTIRAAVLLFWYNLPAVLLSVIMVIGCFWMVLWLNNVPFWAHIFLLSGCYLMLLFFVAFLIVVYTTSVYEHEEEVF